LQSRNYDKTTKKIIIDTEEKAIFSFVTHLNNLLSNLDSHPGLLHKHNYEHYINNAFTDVHKDVHEHVVGSLPHLYSFGDDKAEEKTATIHSLKNKFSIENTLFKKIARSTDRHKMDMEYRRSHVGGKIKTLADEMKNEILKGLDDHINASILMKNIMRKQRDQYDKELAQTSDNELRQHIKGKIKELYSKQQYKIERVVRTEAMNVVSRAQLLRYQDRNVKEVYLETSHDERVCAKCRNLERIKKMWDISKLLLLGAYPLSSITHPQCRCTFTPVINEIELGNDVETIQNIPRNETKEIERLAKEIKVTVPIQFVDNITETPEFIENRTKHYVKAGDPLFKAKLLAENDQAEMKGQVATLTVGQGKDKKILIDIRANKSNRFTYIISRIQAKYIWGRRSSKQTIIPEFNKLFKQKHFDRTLDSHKLLFFSRNARKTVKEFFCEAYAHFVVHPQVLKEVDRDVFDYLKFHVFNGRDFLNHNF